MSYEMKKGDRIKLETVDAIYAFCDVIGVTPKNLQVRYCKKVDLDKSTQRMVPVFATDTVEKSKIVSAQYLG